MDNDLSDCQAHLSQREVPPNSFPPPGPKEPPASQVHVTVSCNPQGRLRISSEDYVPENCTSV